jgi:cytochrome c553
MGIVSTRVEIEGSPAVRLPTAVLPVDLATNGRELVVVAAGNAFTKELPQIYVLFVDALKRGNTTGFGSGQIVGCANAVQGNVPGQAIAAAFDGKDELVVQTREPAAIHIMTEDRRRPWKTIALPGETRQDTGHIIFHANAGGFLACASCHAEGGDDGHTWTFQNMGPRRTPSLLGTVKGTEPFHWDGDQRDLRMLVDNVFTQRMSGPQVDDQQLDALGGWVFALPPPAKLQTETEAVVRGKKLFDARCTTCHDGPMLTNNRTVDVGTGKALQVPSLVGVAWRAPFIHTGCAATLFDRFSPECGGAQHGDTKDLTQSDIKDLVSFLETL